jgi:hypothetical protein
VTRNVFVNADTGAAIELREDTAIREFIRGDISEDEVGAINDSEVEPAPEEEDIAYYIIVTDESGEVVDRIPIREGQDATIVSPNDERAAGGNETEG